MDFLFLAFNLPVDKVYQEIFNQPTSLLVELPSHPGMKKFGVENYRPGAGVDGGVGLKLIQ